MTFLVFLSPFLSNGENFKEIDSVRIAFKVIYIDSVTLNSSLSMHHINYVTALIKLNQESVKKLDSLALRNKRELVVDIPINCLQEENDVWISGTLIIQAIEDDPPYDLMNLLEKDRPVLFSSFRFNYTIIR